MPIPSGGAEYVGSGTTIRLLSDDGERELWIRKATPTAQDNIYCKNWDPGWPTPRESSEERTGQSGIRDDTYLHGSSVFRAELRIASTDLLSHWEVMDEFDYWFAPEARHYVVIAKPDGSDAWQARYRADPLSLVAEQKSHTIIDASLQLVIPDGVYESLETLSYTLRPLGTTAGITFPLTFPFEFTPSSGGGSVELVVGGSRPVAPKVYIYGGQNGPVITDTDTGVRLSFTALNGLDIPLGSYVEIDFLEGTALMNGDPNNSVYQYIDFSISSWWLLRPGEVNRIAVTATSSDGSAQTLIEYKNRRIRPQRG